MSVECRHVKPRLVFVKQPDEMFHNDCDRTRRSAISSNGPLILGDHSHRRRHPLRGCMTRRGRLYSDKSRFGYPGTRHHLRCYLAHEREAGNLIVLYCGKMTARN